MSNDAIDRFLRSYDFMRLGQAINRAQWQSAAMIQRRMVQNAQVTGLESFQRPLANMRQAIMHKSSSDAKQILAGMVARRAQMMNCMK